MAWRVGLVFKCHEDRVRSLRGIVLEDGVKVLQGNRIDECIKARGKLKGDPRIA